MKLQKIRETVDTKRTGRSHVVFVGFCRQLAEGLARSNLGRATAVDYDRFSAGNIPRQDAYHDEEGQLKVEGIARSLLRVNPNMSVTLLPTDFCAIGREEFDSHFGDADLFVFATDKFHAQARGNLEIMRLRKPAVWIGMYAQGRAGEVIWYVPGVTPACFRCIASSRYQAFAEGHEDIPSDGGTIFDMHLVDAVAGAICLGILTRGANNRYGRLIEELDDRNLMQIKLDPNYTLGGRDIFREYLGDHPANFSFNTIALPMEPEDDCPDCGRFRARRRARA